MRVCVKLLVKNYIRQLDNKHVGTAGITYILILKIWKEGVHRETEQRTSCVREISHREKNLGDLMAQSRQVFIVWWFFSLVVPTRG